MTHTREHIERCADRLRDVLNQADVQTETLFTMLREANGIMPGDVIQNSRGTIAVLQIKPVLHRTMHANAVSRDKVRAALEYRGVIVTQRMRPHGAGHQLSIIADPDDFYGETAPVRRLGRFAEVHTTSDPNWAYRVSGAFIPEGSDA